MALRAAVTAVESCRVVVIGAGFIGAEVASTCAGLGCRVTVIEAMEIPLSNVLGPLLGAHCASLYEANGVDLRTGRRRGRHSSRRGVVREERLGRRDRGR